MPTAEQVAAATGLEVTDHGVDPCADPAEMARPLRIWIIRFEWQGRAVLARLSIHPDFIEHPASESAAAHIRDLAESIVAADARVTGLYTGEVN